MLGHRVKNIASFGTNRVSLAYGMESQRVADEMQLDFHHGVVVTASRNNVSWWGPAGIRDGLQISYAGKETGHSTDRVP